jgi:drug/metabolite transporter (DMT)-like permease
MKAKDWLAFIALGTIWGSSFLWIKLAVQETSPAMLVAFRLLFAILTLSVVVLFARPRWPHDRRLGLFMFIFGFTNSLIPYVLISWGELYIDSAVAAILNSTTPLFAMIIAHLLLSDDRITLPRLAGLVIGFIGIVILVSRDLNGELARLFQPSQAIQLASISLPGFSAANFALLGQLAVLLASLFYAFSSVFARRNMRDLSPIIQGLVPLLGADAFLWILLSQVEQPLVLPTLPITWISLLWLGILGTGLAFLLYFYLIHAVGPTRATLVTYVFPLVGVILGVLILHEQLDWQLAVGGALIVGSIVVVNQKS